MLHRDVKRLAEMTNPVKAVTKQVQKLHLVMILTYVTSVQLIFQILKILKSSNMSSSWVLSSLSVEPYEPTYHTIKYTKFEKRIDASDWVLWVFTHGFSSEDRDMK